MEHSWALLTENFAGEKRSSLNTYSDLAQLNGKTLKFKPTKLHVCYNFFFQSAKSAKSVKIAKLLHKTAKSAKSLSIKSAALTCTTRETLDSRQEIGDRRQETTGDRRQEMGDRRR